MCYYDPWNKKESYCGCCKKKESYRGCYDHYDPCKRREPYHDYDPCKRREPYYDYDPCKQKRKYKCCVCCRCWYYYR